MDNKISFTMKLMLLVTVKTARLQSPGGMINDSWRVTVGFPAPSDYKGAGKPTVDAQMRLWGATDGYNCLKRCMKTDRHPQSIISCPPRRLQTCRFYGHQ